MSASRAFNHETTPIPPPSPPIISGQCWYILAPLHSSSGFFLSSSSSSSTSRQTVSTEQHVFTVHTPFRGFRFKSRRRAHWATGLSRLFVIIDGTMVTALCGVSSKGKRNMNALSRVAEENDPAVRSTFGAFMEGENNHYHRRGSLLLLLLECGFLQNIPALPLDLELHLYSGWAWVFLGATLKIFKGTKAVPRQAPYLLSWFNAGGSFLFNDCHRVGSGSKLLWELNREFPKEEWYKKLHWGLYSFSWNHIILFHTVINLRRKTKRRNRRTSSWREKKKSGPHFPSLRIFCLLNFYLL